MDVLYSPLVWPQVQKDCAYCRPILPPTFVRQAFFSPTWDVYSSDPKDRTEYWEDSDGTMTLQDVQAAL